MSTILVDMDGVVADTHGYAMRLGFLKHAPCTWNLDCCLADGFTINDVFCHEHIFAHCDPIRGAVDGVRKLALEHDVYFCSTPWEGNPDCASQKYEWINRIFGPNWGKRLILAHNKSMVRGDLLIDDRPDVPRGEWRQVLYPQTFNQSTYPSWSQGLADLLLDVLP